VRSRRIKSSSSQWVPEFKNWKNKRGYYMIMDFFCGVYAILKDFKLAEKDIAERFKRIDEYAGES
jgi:hypothetical protein